jgi:hypothetical protein
MVAEEKNRDEHKEDMRHMEIKDREREHREDKEPQVEEEQERPVVEEGKEVGEEKEHARTEEEQERPDVEEEVEGSHVPFDTATDHGQSSSMSVVSARSSKSKKAAQDPSAWS